MNDTVVNFKTNSALKRRAQRKAEELGISLSTALNALLRKFIRTKDIDFIDERDRELTDWAKRALKRAEADIKAGRVSPILDNLEDEFAWLDDSNARYQNGDRVR